MYFFSIKCNGMWLYYLHVSLFVNMFLKDKTFSNIYKANTCTVVNALK